MSWLNIAAVGLCAVALMVPLVGDARAAAASEVPGIPDGWSDGYVYANGIRIHYYRALPAPGKPVVVMYHGVTDNGLGWAGLARQLQGSYDVYMVDARGHGLSDPFTPADDRDTMVNDAVEFVRAMMFERPILVGHSMGAATVMRVGAEHPDLARAIVMLDPFLNGGAPGAGPPRRRAPASTRAASTAPARLSLEMAGSPEALVAQNNYRFEEIVEAGRRTFPKWDLLDVQYWALAKKQYHGAYSPQAWQAMSGTMGVGDSLARITVPAMVLKADASPEQRKTNEAAARVMQKGRLVHIDGGGHNLHHDEPQRTIEALKDFLSTL